MADNPGQWAIPKFYFRCTLDGAQISFSECSGLDQENETMEYRHGDSESFITQKRLGLNKTATLTLKRGVFTDDDRTMEIFNRVYDRDYYSTEDGRMEILIELLDEHGDTVRAWSMLNAIPTKFGSTDMKSDSNEIAIESIEFVHEGLTHTLAG